MIALRLNRGFQFLIYGLVFVFIQACSEPGPKQGEGAGRYGMIDPNTPHYAAMKFFEHIYYDENLDGAIELSSPRLARVLKSYHTNRNVQRHVLNLSYDEVNIQPDAGNSVGRTEFAKKAVITLFFTGKRNGDQYEDIRIVEMVKRGSDWKVDKVRADKYL